MSIPWNLNLDALTIIALQDILSAVDGWANGRPTDEVALLNRITEKLSRRRRGCDVGLQHPMTVSAQVANLHRRGPNQTDLYGSDLALTISIDGQAFVKTAFFQFKKTDNYSALIEKRQLDQAMSNTSVGQRAFIAAIDETRLGIRIGNVAEIYRHLPSITQHTETRDTSNWMSMSEWLHRWLSCEIGLASDPNDPASVETLLQGFSPPPPRDEEWLSAWRWPAIKREVPDIVPAKSWVAMFLKTDKDIQK